MLEVSSFNRIMNAATVESIVSRRQIIDLGRQLRRKSRSFDPSCASPLGEVTRGGRSSCLRAGVASWATRDCERQSKIGVPLRSICEQAVIASTPPAHDPRDPLDIVIQ